MNWKKIIKISLSVIGAIIVGAIGSGVWKYILEPTLSIARDTILNIAVLGAEKYKNSIYQEIASGFHEMPSIEVYYYITLIFASGVILAVIATHLKVKDIIDDREKLLSRLKSLLKGEKEESVNLSEMYDGFSKRNPKRLIYMSRICIILVLIYATLLFMSYYRSKYINSAITHFNQMCAIVKPYIDSQKEDHIISEYAQISSKQDYAKLISQLENIAKENSVNIPEFEPW